MFAEFDGWEVAGNLIVLIVAGSFLALLAIGVAVGAYFFTRIGSGIIRWSDRQGKDPPG